MTATCWWCRTSCTTPVGTRAAPAAPTQWTTSRPTWRAWRTARGWDHLWVSSYDSTYHHDWGWTRTDDKGREGQLPGYSYYLRKDGRTYLTYMTTARGTEAVLPTAHVMDRTVYGRQQDWEDSPAGWPQHPTYG